MVSPVLGQAKKISAKQIVLMYQRKPAHFKDFANRWYVVDILKKLDYNKRTRQIFLAKVKQRLIKEIKKQKLPKEVINDIWVCSSSDVFDNYITTHPPLRELLSVLKRYFEIKEVCFNPLQKYKAGPNFVLKPR